MIRRKKVKDFNFYLMSYVDGIAVDRKLNAVNDEEKLYWLNKISEIMVKVHSIKARIWIYRSI